MHAGATKEALDAYGLSEAIGKEGHAVRFADCDSEELKLLCELLFQRLLLDQMNQDTPKGGRALWRLTQDVSAALRMKEEAMKGA